MRGASLVRSVDVRNSIGVEPLEVVPPIRILGMVAAPRELGFLDVERERALVTAALEEKQREGAVELHWLEGQTWRDLQEAMWRGPWHVFHFIGHGGFYRPESVRRAATRAAGPAEGGGTGQTIGEGYLALANDDGSLYILRASQLGRLLYSHPQLRMVYLAACEGARGAETDLFSSTAATLLRRGIPSVLAMQDAISDVAAIEFSRTFYRAVAHGLPVDAAVTEARIGISLAISGTAEWGVPVLFMNQFEGVLFNVKGSAG
jgi:hypothetical protein